MKTKSFLLFTVFIFCISCGGIERPEIPLIEKEITFFDQLNHHPLTIDSVTREIEIGVFLWRKFAKDIIINIYSYSTKDSLTVKEWNSLSAEIASFYSTQEIEGIKFTSCLIYYKRDQNANDYFYSYDIENNTPVLKSKSYELEEEEKQQALSIEDTAD